MDYVVFGIGFGATVLVLGLLVRDLGPHLRFRESSDGDDVLHAEELVGKVAWSRFCVALGSVLAIAGALVVLVTIACMLLVLSDETGQWVMLGTLAATLLIVLFWTWAFFDRFGSYGILPERRRAVETPEPEIQPARSETTVVVGPQVPSPDVPAQPADTADAEAVEPVADAAGDETAAETAVASDTESVPAAEAEPPAGESAGENNRTEPNPQDSERRLQTPEERLARMESPVNHGSAEGDLDIAAVGPKRPAPRGVRRAQPAVDATTNTSEQTEDVSEVNGEDHRSPGNGTAG